MAIIMMMLISLAICNLMNLQTEEGATAEGEGKDPDRK